MTRSVARRIWLPALALLSAACTTARVPTAEEVARAIFTGEAAEWIDLSHSFDSTTIYWPTARPFQLETVSAEYTERGYYYATNDFCASEHGGTHVDAPIHFVEGRRTVDEVPIDQLIGPAVVVDVSEAAATDPDYRVTIADLQAWEREHGPIPEGVVLLLRTGWGERWPDPERYLGTARRGPEAVAELHFPGLHADAARWLVANRNIAAVGLDTPSIDYGQSRLFEAHQALFEAEIPALENVASLDRLPPTGAYVIALPMKIAGGSGGPARIVAVLL